MGTFKCLIHNAWLLAPIWKCGGVKVRDERFKSPSQNPNFFRPLRGLFPKLDCLISRARLTVDSGALQATWAAPALSAGTAEKIRHPREFQSCFEQTPVPRGRVVHPLSAIFANRGAHGLAVEIQL
jgi:hypothetical protein